MLRIALLVSAAGRFAQAFAADTPQLACAVLSVRRPQVRRERRAAARLAHELAIEPAGGAAVG